MRQEVNIVKFDNEIPLSFSVIRFDDVFPHMHSVTQLSIVIEGECEVTFNNKMYTAKEKDIFIINQKTTHALRANGTCTILNALIDQNGFKLSSEDSNNIYFDLNSMENPINRRYEDIKYLIYSIVKFNMMENVNSLYTNKAIAYSLFAQLINNFRVDISESSLKHRQSDTITSITSYINDHYKENITLVTLADEFNYSTAYLSRLFKQTLNTNFIDFYDNIRVNYSLNDLLLTNYSIERIATENGFENSRSFVRAFTKIYNMYPSEYRSQKNTLPNDSFDSAEFRKDMIEKIANIYDAVNANKGGTETVKTTQEIVSVNVKTQVAKTQSPQTKLLKLGDVNLLYADSIYKCLKKIQSEIGFEYLLMNVNEKKCSVNSIFYQIDEEYFINPVSINYSFSILNDVHINPYFKFYLDKDKVHNNNFANTIVNLFEYIGSNIGETNPVSIMLSFDSNYKDYDLYEYLFGIYRRVKKINNLRFSFGGVSFSKSEMLDSNSFKQYVDFLAERKMNLDFYPIHYFDKDNKKHIIKDRNHIKNFLYSIKEKDSFFENKMYLEDISFTNEDRNLLNDTLYNANYIVKNVIDNIKSLGAFSTGCLVDHVYDCKDPFDGKNGLITYNLIKKASYNAYLFLSKLQPVLIKKSKNYIITSNGKDKFAIIVNNYQHYADLYAEKAYYILTANNRYSCFPVGTKINFSIELKKLNFHSYKMKISHLNQTSGSSYDRCLEYGDRNDFTYSELNGLKSLSDVEFKLSKGTIIDNTLQIDVEVNPLGIELIEIQVS